MKLKKIGKQKFLEIKIFKFKKKLLAYQVINLVIQII